MKTSLDAVQINDQWILDRRPDKNPVDPFRTYAYLVEKEMTTEGQVENVATVFLTNRECPFHCLMCDLWKNTTDKRVPDGAIPMQIKWALKQLPGVRHIKLYNSGNFFDVQAIPPADIPEIISLLSMFKTVIIENHPKLIDERCLEFRDRLQPDLQVAMGLETVHTDGLRALNKRMTLEDFENAAVLLTKNDIRVRAFILLRPPFLSESEGIVWAKRSIDFAFDVGVECCVIIPTRGGNGALEELESSGYFSPPKIQSLEETLEYGIGQKKGRVFADLWDIEKFSSCNICIDQRIQRMQEMNLTQQIPSHIRCDCDNRW